MKIVLLNVLVVLFLFDNLFLNLIWIMFIKVKKIYGFKL